MPGWQWRSALAEQALPWPPQQHPGPQRPPSQPLELQDLSPQRPAKHETRLPTMPPDAQPPPAVQAALQRNARLQPPQLRLHQRSPRRTHFAASAAGEQQLPGQIRSPERSAGRGNFAHAQQERRALLLSPEGLTPNRRAGTQRAAVSGQASNSAMPGGPIVGPHDAQSSTRPPAQQASPTAGWRQWPVHRDHAPVHLAGSLQGRSGRLTEEIAASDRRWQPRWQVCKLSDDARGTLDAQHCCSFGNAHLAQQLCLCLALQAPAWASLKDTSGHVSSPNSVTSMMCAGGRSKGRGSPGPCPAAI